MRLNRALQRLADGIQFGLDLYPGWLYHPLPWVGIHNAKRSDGTRERWAAIQEDIRGRNIRTAMDIGCHVGFFCFSLADIGVQTIGVEVDERALRIARFVAKKRAQTRSDAFVSTIFMQMKVTPENVERLPEVEMVLLMSIWHHYVRSFGLQGATDMLRTIWRHTQKVLYFDTGQQEMTADYGLPEMGAAPNEWIANYLSSSCENARVKLVGNFKAFTPGGDNAHKIIYRGLFCVERMETAPSSGDR